MRVLIKRRCLSYGRHIYRAGETANIADADLARRLVAKSHGDFELVSGDCGKTSYAAAAASGETAQKPITEEETVSENVSGKAEEEADIEETAEPAALPAVDFADTVKKTTSGKRK